MPKRREAQFEVIGHRGGGAGPDENTLASCRRAVREGAARLEIDVRFEGGTLTTAHDPGQSADTLPNILRHIRIPLILHIKESGRRFPFSLFFSRRYYRRTIDAVAPLVAGRDVTLTSFAPGALRYCRRRYPGLRTGLCTFWPSYDLLHAHRLEASECYAYDWSVSRRSVDRARRLGMPLVVVARRSDQATRERLETLRVRSVMVDDVSFWAGAPVRPAQRR